MTCGSCRETESEAPWLAWVPILGNRYRLWGLCEYEVLAPTPQSAKLEPCSSCPCSPCCPPRDDRAVYTVNFSPDSVLRTPHNSTVTVPPGDEGQQEILGLYHWDWGKEGSSCDSVLESSPSVETDSQGLSLPEVTNGRNPGPVGGLDEDSIAGSTAAACCFQQSNLFWLQCSSNLVPERTRCPIPHPR